jgi:hypothetical protein
MDNLPEDVGAGPVAVLSRFRRDVYSCFTSATVRKFEEVYQPELAAGPVVFTDYLQIASNQSR